MELQELKSAWKSVEPHISRQDYHDDMLKGFVDTKTSLLRRTYISMVFTILGLLLFATSILWAPSLLPIWWIVALCGLLVIGIFAELYLAKLVKRIEFESCTHSQILDSVIRIKVYYRNMELWISGGAVILFGVLSFTPSFFNIWDMALVWGLLVLGLGLEFVWYKKSTRYINQLKKWTK